MTRARTARSVARALFVGAVVATVYASLLPPADLPSAFGISDKLLHLVGYAVLGALAVASGLRWPAAVITVIALGLALEIAQGILGYRSFEWADLLADAAGASLGVAVATGLAHRTGARSEESAE